MKNTMLLRTTLVSSIAFALTACGGGSNSNTPTSPPADQTRSISSMSVVNNGFQTFKPRAHDLTGYRAYSRAATLNTPLDDGQSAYVYENPENGEVSSISFEGDDAESVVTPTIDMIVDLNTTYSAINMSNVTVTVDDVVYEGNYTLIQDKNTGDLYPLVKSGVPIYKKVEAEHEAWITDTRFSHNGDSTRIYLRHSDELSLHKAELIDGTFVISKVFDNYFRNNVILSTGDIVTVPWSGNSLTWVKQDGTEHNFNYDTSQLSVPFLYADKLYAIRDSDDALIELTLNGATLDQTDALWTTNGYRPSSMSVVRGDYKMHSDCSVYQFDDTTKTITQLEPSKAHSGHVANAGQTSLYCMYSSTDDNSALPSFMRFDVSKAELNQPATTTTDASSGTKLDANERMAVVSDNELMFYQYPSGTFTEYYINFDAGTTVEKEVSSITAIKMQTVTQN
ncbi:hypothetical protein BCU30_008695 [Vibrio lentus]|uniref:hypothetical protein n=1 Tax=Vibrio lentus TaxID=136468 RepID=UPI000C85D243|nr:hypothetical protein [Vibrio lentus]PMJ14512.1 hypothetical protein BCU30_01415 [Vibrio lentus]